MTAEGAVDVSSLLMLRELQKPGSPDAVGRIVDRFLAESPQRIAALRTAIRNDDARLLEQAAHALKGIAGTVGANEMRDIAHRLEQLGRQGSTAGAGHQTAELEAALARARPIFDRLRGNDQGA
ncbi:MAG TPA: Hpt domain-containing protein [Chloroflexota bacterium]